MVSGGADRARLPALACSRRRSGGGRTHGRSWWRLVVAARCLAALRMRREPGCRWPGAAPGGGLMGMSIRARLGCASRELQRSDARTRLVAATRLQLGALRL